MNHNTLAKWFWIFCTLHVVIWTVGLTWARKNLPFDTVEAITWGNQWQWGYNKHPPFAPWLLALFAKINTSWAVYLLSSLAIVVAFYAVWRLAQRIVTPIQALAAVFLLEGVIYYNVIAEKLNPTTMMTPVWALIMWVAYLAVADRKWWLWVVLGFLAAISVLTKYEAPFLLIPVFLWTLMTPEGRRHYRTPAPYVALIVMVIVLLPHLWWNMALGFPEIHYALNSGAGDLHAGHVVQGWLAHLYYPVNIFISEVGAVAGLILISLLWVKGERGVTPVSYFNKSFLWTVGLGPFIFILLVSVLTGDYLYAKWCTPYFSLLGLMVVVWRQPVFNTRTWRRFVIAVAVVASLMWLGRIGDLVLGPSLTHDAQADAYFPGKAIAEDVTTLWRNTYHRPLYYVAGSHYLVAHVAVYSPDHPVPYMDWSKTQSPWVNEADLKKQGALFAWWVTSPADKMLPKAIATRFPKAKYMGTFTFTKKVDIATPVVEIAVAFLPPGG